MITITVLFGLIWFCACVGYIALRDVDDWDMRVIASLLSLPVVFVLVCVLLGVR